MVQALISIDFLKNFQKFESFKISEFKNSSEIDIESFMFINQLLFTNKSNWFLNVREDKILEYKFKELNDIPEEEQSTAVIIKGFRQNKIESAYNLYYQIQRQEYSLINKSLLPNYIFLGKVDAVICKSIEENLGVICISIGSMKVTRERRQVVLKNLKNTREALFESVSELPYNNLHIEDSYFSTNYKDNYEENNSLLNKVMLHSLSTLTIKTRTDTLLLETQQKNLDCIRPNSLSTSIKNGARHDRIIYTNSSIVALGNSLFRNTSCSFVQFPIGLYSDFFD